MRCSNPNVIKHWISEYGDIQAKFIGPFVSSGLTLEDLPDDISKGHWYSIVPCGHCSGCRIDHSRDWAVRCYMEYLTVGKAIFVTLTYDNDHLPLAFGHGDVNPTLDVRDLQLFFKRLRKFFHGKKIRYVASGEYGLKTFRPHYHAIIFGVSLEDFPDRFFKSKNENGDIFYSSGIFDDLWKNGFSLLSDVSFSTMSYVARYTLKKTEDTSFLNSYQSRPFLVASKSPAIGFDYAVDILNRGLTTVPIMTRKGLVHFPIPQSLMRLFNVGEIDILDKFSYNKLVNSDGFKRQILNGSRNVEQELCKIADSNSSTVKLLNGR